MSDNEKMGQKRWQSIIFPISSVEIQKLDLATSLNTQFSYEHV